MNRRLVPVALFTAALLLFSIGVASATLQTTNVLEAWDYATNPPKYTNGNQTLWLNGEPETFYTQLDFDAGQHAGACGAANTNTTRWAGDAYIGLYHTDNGPGAANGAPGFVSTNAWKLVKCSAFGPQPNDTIRLPTASDILAECIPGIPGDGPCVLVGTADAVTPCSSGNCLNEIVTNFDINTDLACDGTQDEPFATEWQAGNLCMYWEAVKPPAKGWNGNFQVRYGTGSGGDKTINFKDTFYGPNAVSMSSLTAVADANRGSLAALAGGMLLAALGLFVWRRNS